MPDGLPMIMDKAYESDEMRQLVLNLGMIPVVPPKCNRSDPWEYNVSYIRNARRSSGSFAGSRASGAFSPGSKSWMLSFSHFSTSHSSSKRYA
jgi:hypothetical protein